MPFVRERGAWAGDGYGKVQVEFKGVKGGASERASERAREGMREGRWEGATESTRQTIVEFVGVDEAVRYRLVRAPSGQRVLENSCACASCALLWRGCS